MPDLPFTNDEQDAIGRIRHYLAKDGKGRPRSLGEIRTLAAVNRPKGEELRRLLETLVDRGDLVAIATAPANVGDQRRSYRGYALPARAAKGGAA